MTTSDTMTTRDETVTAIAKGIANGTPYRVMDLAADLDLTTAEVHARIDGCMDRNEIVLRGKVGDTDIHDEDTLELTTTAWTRRATGGTRRGRDANVADKTEGPLLQGI